MATISTNRLSLVEYSSSNFGYIRSLACLSGICVNNFEGENTFNVTLDSILTDSYLSYLQNFTNGFTLFVRLSGNDGIVSPSKTYTLKLKGSDEPRFTSVGTVLITKETTFLSNDVLIMHQIKDGRFIICNRDLEIPCLSSSAHASNNAYTVLGIGATTNSSKFLRSDGTWQTPSNTTYTTLATNAHASGTNYVVNGPGNSTNTFLRGDGTWQTPSNTTYATLANNAHASGTSYLVNGIGSTTNAKEFLRNDGTWKAPTDTTYATLTSSDHARVTPYVVIGMGTVPSGRDIEKYYLTGSGNWKYTLDTIPPLTSTNHSSSEQYSIYGIGSTTNTTSFLRNDGTWQTPANTTYAALATNAHATNTSYVVKGSGYSSNPSKFLREDGTWQTPTNTTYKQLNATNYSASEGHVIKGPGTTYSDYAALRPAGNWGEIYGLFGSIDGVDTNKKYVIHGLDDAKDPMEPGELRRYYLCANGEWNIPDGSGGGGGTTYATLSASAHASNASYVIRGIGSSTNSSSYLRSDGSWHTPTNTTYGTFTSTANGLVPKPTASTATTNYVLAGNGTWVTMSGGSSAPQAWGLYGFPGTPVRGLSMPTSQNRSNFPIVHTKYDGTTAVTSVLFPANQKELTALPVEISRDGIIYVPVSYDFSVELEKWGYELVGEK